MKVRQQYIVSAAVLLSSVPTVLASNLFDDVTYTNEQPSSFNIEESPTNNRNRKEGFSNGWTAYAQSTKYERPPPEQPPQQQPEYKPQSNSQPMPQQEEYQPPPTTQQQQPPERPPPEQEEYQQSSPPKPQAQTGYEYMPPQPSKPLAENVEDGYGTMTAMTQDRCYGKRKHACKYKNYCKWYPRINECHRRDYKPEPERPPEPYRPEPQPVHEVYDQPPPVPEDEYNNCMGKQKRSCNASRICKWSYGKRDCIMKDNTYNDEWVPPPKPQPTSVCHGKRKRTCNNSYECKWNYGMRACVKKGYQDFNNDYDHYKEIEYLASRFRRRDGRPGAEEEDDEEEEYDSSSEDIYGYYPEENEFDDYDEDEGDGFFEYSN